MKFGTRDPSADLYLRVLAFVFVGVRGCAHKQSALRLIITGAPACGKGTQCSRFINKFDLVHISTGEILRKAVEEGTELGVTAKSHMDKGELVRCAQVYFE